jgi:hypothetical protein
MSVIVIYNDSDNGNDGDNYKRAWVRSAHHMAIFSLGDT